MIKNQRFMLPNTLYQPMLYQFAGKMLLAGLVSKGKIESIMEVTITKAAKIAKMRMTILLESRGRGVSAFLRSRVRSVRGLNALSVNSIYPDI